MSRGLARGAGFGVVLVVAAVVAVVVGAPAVSLWLLLAVPLARNVVVAVDVDVNDRVALAVGTVGLLLLYGWLALR
jgi:hypothetical protein